MRTDEQTKESMLQWAIVLAVRLMLFSLVAFVLIGGYWVSKHGIHAFLGYEFWRMAMNYAFVAVAFSATFLAYRAIVGVFDRRWK